MKKWIPRIIFGVIIALIILLGLFFFVGKEKSKDENSDIIVKDNVKVISSKMNEDELPVQVADDRVVFKKKPKYKKGDVIVCGSIDAYSARTAHPFQRNGAPFRFKLSKAQQVD